MARLLGACSHVEHVFAVGFQFHKGRPSRWQRLEDDPCCASPLSVLVCLNQRSGQFGCVADMIIINVGDLASFISDWSDSVHVARSIPVAHLPWERSSPPLI